MKNQDLALLGVRLLALFVLVQMGQQLVWTVAITGDSSNLTPARTLLMALPPILLLALGLGLFVAAPRIAALLLSDSEAVGELGSASLQAMFIATIGVFLVVRSFPSLASMAVGLLFPETPMGASIRSSAVSASQITFVALQLLLGVLLFFRADGLARFWHRLRDSRYDLGD